MKYLLTILCFFISIIIFMKSLSLLNKGSLILPILGISIIYLIFYTIIKTKLFTKLKFKKN
jgi:lipopolysaccharide export LptBFGC system permease protein LptF